MNPQELFCPNDACPSRGLIGQGNITVHSQKEQRCYCKRCGKTFAISKGTAFYGLHQERTTFLRVVTLLAYGCPLQAIVAAFDLDERTVADWHKKAGGHCQQVHEYLVEQPRDLRCVQADEMRCKLSGQIVWLAMAMQVTTRLWLGGVVSVSRDRTLLSCLARKIRACALCCALLVCVDGFGAYVACLYKAFRSPAKTGQRGRPLLLSWSDFCLGQMLKQYQKGRVVGTIQRLVQGTSEQALQLATTAQMIHTAYIERLNATFRQRLAALVRRGRALCKQVLTLQAGVYLVGSVYNFCTPHQSLRQEQPHGRKWRQRTPAMAAGLTEHAWTVEELLTYRVPLPPFVPKKRRGRPPGAVTSLVRAMVPAIKIPTTI